MVGKIESLNEKNQGDGIFMEHKGYFWMLFEHRKYLSLICVITYLFVLSLVDEFNLPSRLVLWLCEYAHYQLPFILGCVCAISVLIVMINYVEKIIITSSSNAIDHWICICGLVAFIYSIISRLLCGNNWKIYGLFVIVYLSIRIIAYRAYRYYELQINYGDKNLNLYDLKDIYEKGVGDANPNMPILISDEAVEYDLLEREFIINNLLNDIQVCQSERSFVIGLEGEWGSGKTTIVNIVKARLNKRNIINKVSDANRYVVLSDFNLWLYNDNETFLLEMFDAILKASGATYSFIQRKEAERVLRELLAHNNMTSVINTLLFTPKKLGNKLQKIKRDIELYLEYNNKILVLFIDDIDRALPENVVFLFKALSLILDLKRTIYILSYDPKQLQHIFSTGMQIDPKYIEKIVHLRIKVDVPSATMADVCSKSLRDIVAVYDMENKNKYDNLISNIISNVKNIREFKRIVNSVLYAPMAYNTHLYKPDLLYIEYIKYAKYDLYKLIYDNREYLVSHDISDDIELSINRIDKKSFRENATRVRQRLAEEDYKPYASILEELFPIDYSQYNSYEEIPNIRDNIDVTRNARICSANYFDLYFNYASNTYIELKDDVLQFIKIVNKGENVDVMFAKSTTSYEQNKWFNFFYLFIRDISTTEYVTVTYLLFKSIYTINDTPQNFFSLSPRSMAILSMSWLLTSMNEETLKSVLDQIKYSYSKICVIYKLKEYAEKNDSQKYEIINENYTGICNRIITCKINLYADDNYYYHNIDGLLMFYQEKPEIIREYISSIISSENIYRILGDTISYSFGSDYSYFMAKERCEFLFGNTNIDVSDLLDEHPPTTESEKFVLKIYTDRRTRNPDADGGMGNVVVHKPFIFDL